MNPPTPIEDVIVPWCQAHPAEAREGYEAMEGARPSSEPDGGLASLIVEVGEGLGPLGLRVDEDGKY